MKRKFDKKKQAGFVSVMLALALLLTGSLAWQDVSQHKTSNFQTATLEHHVVLVQEFETKEQWIADPSDSVVKTVAVRNGEDNNPLDIVYDDAYVRIQLKQFMEIGTWVYTYSDDRYMIDTDGNFVSGKTQTEVEAQLTALGLDPLEYASDIEQVFAYFDGEQDEDVLEETASTWYYYVKTKANDPNGQYGKHVIIDAGVESMVSIVDGIDRSTDNEDDHHAPENRDDLYSTKVWYDDHEINALFDEYVVWEHNDSYITLTEWREEYDSEPVKMWIVDDTSEEGWIYWGYPLVHSQTADVPNTMTTNFLESVELIKQPNDVANYQIHVNLDAVSLDDLKLWDDAPGDLVGALGFKADTTALRSLFTEANQLVSTYGDIFSDPAGFLASVEEVRLLLSLRPMQAEVDAMVASFSVLLETVKNDVARTVAFITLVEEALETPYLSSTTKTALNTLLSNLEPFTEGAYASAVSSLTAIMTDAEFALDLDDKGVGDTISSFAGYDWVILAIEDGNALIRLSDALSVEDFTAIGFTPHYTDGGYGLIKFHDTFPYVSYDASYLKQVDEAFYNSILKSTDAESVVQPVTWVPEVGATGWDTRTDGPTVVSESGTKKAFSLSVSDINVYGISTANLVIGSSGYEVFLRSPSIYVYRVASISSLGEIVNNNVGNIRRALPALWISVES